VEIGSPQDFVSGTSVHEKKEIGMPYNSYTFNCYLSTRTQYRYRMALMQFTEIMTNDDKQECKKCSNMSEATKFRQIQVQPYPSTCRKDFLCWNCQQIKNPFALCDTAVK
jgi:hypothetical protein